MHEFWIHAVHYLPDGSAIESVRVRTYENGTLWLRDLDHPVSTQVIVNLRHLDRKYFTARPDYVGGPLVRRARVIPDGEYGVHITTVPNGVIADNLESLPRF